ncbi:MAG: phosphoglycerate dehydrogenase [Chloroflexi bacterium]|nr:phosphoglycerate dehydrogenase [Chloroflexota bacterium]
MYRILVAEPLAEEGLARLTASASVDIKTSISRDELMTIIDNYDALIVRSGTKVDRELLAAGSRLRVVGRAGTGVDNIDVESATRQGIVVVNAPASNSVAVAELAMGLILSLARHIPQAHQHVAEGGWSRAKFMGHEVRGKTLGLIGFGRIGAEVARRAKALEMDVVAYDPVVSIERAQQLGVSLASIDDVLQQSDFVSLHVPLVESTRHLINAQRLTLMKRGAYIINAARGGVIDESALVEAIDSGSIAGAAIDAYEQEPPVNSPLLKHPKVITIPHLGASTIEAQAMTGVDVAEGVLDALAGQSPRYAVNAPYIAPEDLGLLAPYAKLARSLGKLCIGVVDDPIQRYEFVYAGELASSSTSPVRTAILQGLLSGVSEQRITPVNAQVIARERGLRFSELTLPEVENYAGMLELRAYTATGKHVFSGTVLRDTPFVVELDGYWVTFEPSGSLLFTYHRDRPGMIGRVGTLLGAHDVNISSMQVGRIAPREQSLMVLTLDDSVPAEVIAQLMNEAHIQRAVALEL